jgi:hypothetical protein
LALLALAPFVAQGASVHLIHLDSPPAVRGGCPAQVHFTGHIETDGPLQVTYQWLRSDGSSTEHTINFPKTGTRDISTNWTINKTYSGWMQLVILSPKREQTINTLVQNRFLESEIKGVPSYN